MSRFFARLAMSIGALLVMMVAALIAVGYFAFALYLFLALYMPAPLAAAATGILILLFSMFLVLATQRNLGRRRRYDGETSREARESAAELGGELGRRLQGLAVAHRTGTLVAALVAGFAVGVSPKLRNFLLDVLKS
jgi:hypothetical protein